MNALSKMLTGAIVCFTIGVLLVSRAMALSLSPLGADEFAGAWEGLVEDEPRAFLMTVREQGKSSVVMAAGSSLAPAAWTFRVRVSRVEAGGNVYVEARDELGTVLKIRGRGFGKRGAAYIKADVELWGNKQLGPSIFATTFHSRTPGYFATLQALISKAQELPASKP